MNFKERKIIHGMKIYCLIENTALFDIFASEHGLSLFIDTGSHKILFDMGQSNAFIKNAEKLGLDLTEVDIAIISHGHYDHGGGLNAFLEVNSKARVYISSHAFSPYFNREDKYIGLDATLKDSPRLVFCDGVTSIDTGLTLFSFNNKKMSFSSGTLGFKALKDGQLVNDDFCHEQYLEIKENGKRFLFSGCSHRGILNIASQLKPDYLIGGFHFSKLSLGGELCEYAKALDGLGTVFYTCHCTGVPQYEFMKGQMRELHYISSGASIEI